MNIQSTISSSKPTWKRPECISFIQLSSNIRRWLLYPNSMTVQLKQASSLLKQELTINVLEEQLEILPSSTFVESLFQGRWAYSRQIQLFSGPTLLMYAKSVLPKNESAIWKRMFRSLGQQPLGKILFSDLNINRSPFEIAKIFPGTTEYNLATLEDRINPEFIWARRSFFSQQTPFLLLTEYFSPNLFSIMNIKVL